MPDGIHLSPTFHGFVAAGLMTLNQTVPVIMGANIGSTITAQIIAFNLSAVTPVILAVGFLLRALGQREALRHLGSMILGVGLLFLGIQSWAMAPVPCGRSSHLLTLCRTCGIRWWGFS